MLDEAFEFFTKAEEPETRLTVLGWQRRLDVLSPFFPNGLEAGPTLSDPAMRLDALYWMAQALSLHGFPGRALTAYLQHDELCRSMGAGQAKRLASALAHHSQNLRLCGRFHDADILAREGLDLQQRVGSPSNVAINLHWFGMGLAHRGEQTESQAVLDESHSFFESHGFFESHKFSEHLQRATGATFSAERALWEGDLETALICAQNASQLSQLLDSEPAHLDKPGARKITATNARIIGNIRVAQKSFVEATAQFTLALRLADEMTLVEGIIPALNGLAAVSLEVGDTEGARRWVDACFPLTHEGPYRIYDCEAHLQLGTLEALLGNADIAKSAARRAGALASCDGAPFSYERGVLKAEKLVTLINIDEWGTSAAAET